MIGARPMESSSSSRIWGSVVSARAMESMRCSPPDNVPASCLRRLVSTGNRAKARSSTQALFSPGRRNVYMSRFSETVRFGKMERPSGIMHTPDRASRSLAFRPSRWPATSTVPAVSASCPEIALSRVVLPAPFGPSSAKAEPDRTSSEIPCSTSMRPYPARTSTAERAGAVTAGRPLSETRTGGGAAATPPPR